MRASIDRLSSESADVLRSDSALGPPSLCSRAAANAGRARELPEERYRAGWTGYLEVIVARQTALAVERSAAASAGQHRITRVVALIRAMSGGRERPAAL